MSRSQAAYGEDGNGWENPQWRYGGEGLFFFFFGLLLSSSSGAWRYCHDFSLLFVKLHTLFL